jgi:hypothetical protein
MWARPANRSLDASPGVAIASRRALACVLICIGAFAMSQASADEDDAFLSLAAPPAATVEFEGERHADACRDLERTVLAYLRNEWRIENRRCFLLHAGTPWNSMEKFVDSELNPNGGKRMKFDWHDPGIDLVAVWKIGRFDAEHIAVAMSKEPVEGQPLVGYFAISKR